MYSELPRLWRLVVGGEPLTHVNELSSTGLVLLGKLGSEGGLITHAFARATGSHAEVRLDLVIKAIDQNFYDYLSIKLDAIASVDSSTPLAEQYLVNPTIHPNGLLMGAGCELWGKLSGSVENPIILAIGGSYLGTPPLREIAANAIATSRKASADAVLALGSAAIATSRKASANSSATLEITSTVGATSSASSAIASSTLEINADATATSRRSSVNAGQDTSLDVTATSRKASAEAIATPGKTSITSATSRRASANGVGIVGRIASAIATSRKGSADAVVSPPFITRAITLTSGTAYTDYPLFVGFNGTNGDASGDDIEVYDSDGTTLIPHYLEPNTTPSDRFVTVKIPSVPSGSKTIYLRYATGRTTSLSTASAIASELTTSSTQSWFSPQDLGLSNNDPVETLTARAGISLTQPTLVKRAVFKTSQLGTRPAIDFDGVDDAYSGLITTASNASIFTIAKFRSMSAEGLLYTYGLQNDGANNLGWAFGRHFGGNDFAMVNPGVGWSSTYPYDTNWNIFEMNLNNSGTTELLRNGTSIISRTATATLQSRFVLGGITVNAGFYNGLVSDIIVVNNCSADARTSIYRYLQQKAGIGSYPSVSVGSES